MDKTQADIEAKKILDEASEKKKKIIQEAKASGTWNQGLDSNNYLFDEVDKEAKEKLKLLASMIA